LDNLLFRESRFLIARTPHLRRPTGLGAGNFRKVAVNGFGDPHNCYAYSCVWYDDHLYVGTFRDALVLIKLRSPFDVKLPFWPIPVPESVWDADLRAQIWRYSPKADLWERVYRSPMIVGREGFEVPLSVGFRNMAVFQGKSDPSPAIYTVTFSSSQGYGPVVLRSSDGLHFEQVSEPALGLGDENLRSFRGVQPFKGRLFATPSGSGGGQVNVSYNVAILCSDDPARGNWQMSNESAFGDPTNLTVFEIAVWNDHLYATTLNVRHGFQVWKTDGEGPPPHRWTKVLDQGADRGPLNQAICGLAGFQGALYLGTGIQGGGIDRQNGIGPAAAELIRLYPDDSWDLVVGQPRVTRQGPKFPASGMGPGFDNFYAGYFWRMCQHDGALYVGTYDWTTFLSYTPSDEWPAAVRNVLSTDAVERLVEARGGADLWRTTDGDRWSSVTTNGMGNRFNYGIRSLISTPAGLFVGTANPFGPKVAVRKAGGFVYEDNPLGGLEIWHGTHDHQGGVGDAAGTLGREGRPTWHMPDGSTPDDVDSIPQDVAPPTDDLFQNRFSPPRRLAAEGETSIVPRSARDATDDRRVTYRVADRRRFDPEQTRHPLVELARADRSLLLPCENAEEEVAEYFADSPLRSVGYWREVTVSPHRASLDLLDEMISLLPGRAAMSDGTLDEESEGDTESSADAESPIDIEPPTDVATSADTASLADAEFPTQAEPPSDVEPSAIVEPPSADLHGEATPSAEPSTDEADEPGATASPLTEPEPLDSLLVIVDGDAAAVTEVLERKEIARRVVVEPIGLDKEPFESSEEGPYDAVFWIEGPSTFDRGRSLATVGRLLKPGGRFVAAELLGYPLDQPQAWLAVDGSREDVFESYRNDLASAGFVDGVVLDIAMHGWLRFFRHSRRYFAIKKLFQLIDDEQETAILESLPGGRLAVDAHVLIAATRPEEQPSE